MMPRNESGRSERDPDLARVGAMIGEPTRAAMLAALLGGQWLTAAGSRGWMGPAPSG